MLPAIFKPVASCFLLAISIITTIILIWVALNHSGVDISVNLGHHTSKYHHVSFEGLHKLVLLWREELVGQVELVCVGELLVYSLVLATTECFVIWRWLFS